MIIGKQRTTWIALISIAVVAVVASVVAMSQDGVRPVSAAVATPQHPVVTDKVFPSVLDEAPEASSLLAARSAVGPRLKTPSVPVLGEAKRVVTFEGGAGAQGLAIEYASRATFQAEPGRPAGDLESRMSASVKDHQTGEVRYPLAERDDLQTLEVAGRFALLRSPGTQSNPDGSSLRYLGYHLAVQDGDILYILDSEDSGLTKEEVLKAAESLFGQ